MEILTETKSLLIAAAVGFVVWFIQWFIQKDKLKLVYSLKQSASFPSGDQIGQAFTIILTNKGNKAILDCKFLIRFASGKIDSYKFDDGRIVSEIRETEKAIDSFIPLLNPKDSLELTITCKNAEKIDSPSIDARAIGITAKAISERNYTNWIIWGTIIILLSWAFYAGEVSDEDPIKEDYIFVTLNESGLGHLFPKIIEANTTDLSYKNTAFILFHNFLIDEENQEKYITALKKLSETDGIAENSQSTIFYLLGKVEQYRNNKEKSEEYFSKSKEAASATYDYLMRHDAVYDLKKLQKELQESRKKNIPDSIK
jgi:hypothetical protein